MLREEKVGHHLLELLILVAQLMHFARCAHRGGLSARRSLWQSDDVIVAQRHGTRPRQGASKQRNVVVQRNARLGEDVALPRRSHTERGDEPGPPNAGMRRSDVENIG